MDTKPGQENRILERYIRYYLWVAANSNDPRRASYFRYPARLLADSTNANQAR